MRVGLISTRFAGMDGVSLEAAKIAPVLAAAGHDLVWLAGELGSDFRPGLEAPELHFAGAENETLTRRAFASNTPNPELDATIRRRAEGLRRPIERFVADMDIDVAFVHNVLSIPMQLPFAVALTGVLHDTGLSAVAHHHDFGWEKPRFAGCAVPDILDDHFPPDLPRLRHVVINSLARAGLRERSGIEATLLPNVLDFERGPSVTGDAGRFREAAGVGSNDIVLLQPTRVVPRKGIEATLEVAAAIGKGTVVAVTHAADRDDDYWRWLLVDAEERGVRLVYQPVSTEDDAAVRLADAFAAADLVCFPSIQEGFGNALVEALWYRRPLLVNRYDVYVADIAPMGVDAVEMKGGVTDEVVDEVRALLDDPDRRRRMVDRNFEVGLEHLSHRVVRERLLPLLEDW